jgi:hypothetical protein
LEQTEGVLVRGPKQGQPDAAMYKQYNFVRIMDFVPYSADISNAHSERRYQRQRMAQWSADEAAVGVVVGAAVAVVVVSEE